MSEAILLHGASGLFSIFAIGMTLRVTTIFPKFQPALRPNKIG